MKKRLLSDMKLTLERAKNIRHTKEFIAYNRQTN